MDKLSSNIIFCILEEVDVDNVPRLSLVDKEFRQACKSKTLWKRIFSKRGLTVLKKSKSIASWVLNFQNSLVSKRAIDGIMNKLDKIQNLREVIKPTRLKCMIDVSIIHVPGVTKKDELEMFISMDSFLNHKNKNLLNKEIFREISNKYTKRSTYDFSYIDFGLEKKRGIYYMVITELDLRPYSDNIEYARYKLNREQVSLLLYKLSYYSLLSLKAPLKER
jgi:hypothetical protein